jgi:hypothetical protein
LFLHHVMLRTLLQISIFGVICVHVLLLYAGYIPTSAAICGMAMQLIYCQNLIDFPAVNFKSFRFILTGGAAPNRLSPSKNSIFSVCVKKYITSARILLIDARCSRRIRTQVYLVYNLPFQRRLFQH